MPALPHFLNACCGPKQFELGPLQLGDRLPLGERFRHRLAVHLGQRRAVVERFQMRHAAGHVQADDPLDLLLELRLDRAGPATALDLGKKLGTQNVCQGECAQTGHRLTQERSAIAKGPNSFKRVHRKGSSRRGRYTFQNTPSGTASREAQTRRVTRSSWTGRAGLSLPPA